MTLRSYITRASQLLLIFLGITFTSTLPLAAVTAEEEKPEAFVLGKGTNLGLWISQTKRKGEDRYNYIQEKDIAYIASLGFKHVRLPIDEKEMWHEDGSRDENAFQIMKNAVDWSLKHN